VVAVRTLGFFRGTSLPTSFLYSFFYIFVRSTSACMANLILVVALLLRTQIRPWTPCCLLYIQWSV
jgi:hypothetical protein